MFLVNPGAKTNWKLLGVVVIFGLLAGGILAWQWLGTEKEMVETPEAENVEFPLKIGIPYRVVWTESTQSISRLKFDDEFIANAPENVKALLALYGYSYGNECDWDGEATKDRSNLKCVLNNAIRVGYQCSNAQLVLLNKYFSDKQYTKQDCPTMPWTSTNQNPLEEIILTQLDKETYKIEFAYIALNMREAIANRSAEVQIFKFAEGHFDEITYEVMTKEEKLKEIIESTTIETVSAIKNRDAKKLSAIVSPSKGVRFSPYAFIRTGEDLIFSASQTENFFADKKTYTWGVYDGKGDSIILTPSDYYDRFIYEKDYAAAKEISYSRAIGRGNVTNNAFEIYPDAIIVEYYLPGKSPGLEEFGWGSLRLVFEKENSAWYLVGIVSDGWTI